MGMGNLTRDQWLTVVTFVVVNFCNAMCVSMQAPFYPREAVSKGLEVWHFGLVFGAFEITVFIVSPIIGNNINKFGVKRTLNIGIGAVGVILILYGCLGMLQSGKLFLAFSFILRMFEACGNSAFLTGSFSAIAREFPTRVASMFSLIELFFGIGEIVGPVVGGALYEIGGFTLPFAVMGSLLFASSIFIFFVLPNPPSIHIEGEKPSMKQALMKPSIAIALFKVMTAAASLGFLQTTLEPHLHDLKINGHPLTSFQVGALFMACGGTYGISLPLWGCLCDSTITRNSPKFVEVVGAVLIGSGFVILGPMKGMPFHKSLVSIVLGMTLHGFGLGASVVGGFSDAHKSAIKAGFPDTIDTYGLVSGLWTSVFAFGAFVGPTLGGILYDALTFKWALLFIGIKLNNLTILHLNDKRKSIGMEIIAILLLVGFLIATWNEPQAPVTRSISTISETDEVADIPPSSYGTGVNVQVAPRSRKFSESIRGSYMASSLARSMARPGVSGLGAASLARRGMGQEGDPLLA